MHQADEVRARDEDAGDRAVTAPPSKDPLSEPCILCSTQACHFDATSWW